MLSDTLAPRQAAGPTECPNVFDLLVEMRELRAQVIAEGESTLVAWGPVARRAGYASPENLAQYLALRHTDLSSLQRRLQALGLSSLGRSEARVITALDAIISTLERLAGIPASPYPGATAMQAADRALRAERDRLFGGCDSAPYSRIMVTLPSEAAAEPRLVASDGEFAATDAPGATRLGPALLIGLALFSIVLFAGAVVFGFNVGPQDDGGPFSPKTLGWILAVVAVACFGGAAFFLLDKVGGQDDELPKA